ncbi:MAG: VOC family protein, partial [Candidatus Thiodiazotropha sp.]
LPRFEYPSDAIVFFDLQGTWLALFPRESLAEDIGMPLNGPGAFTLAHNLSSPEQVDQVMEQALEAGARLIKAPQETFWGGYLGYFTDPDGFFWELAHVPQFWIGPGEYES